MTLWSILLSVIRPSQQEKNQRNWNLEQEVVRQQAQLTQRVKQKTPKLLASPLDDRRPAQECRGSESESKGKKKSGKVGAISGALYKSTKTEQLQ